VPSLTWLASGDIVRCHLVRVRGRGRAGETIRVRSRVEVRVCVSDPLAYFVRVVARLAVCLRVRARLAVRALPAVATRQLAGLGLVLASDALVARCRAIIRRDRAGRTLERLGAAARAPSPCRAGGTKVRRRESMAAVVRPRRAGLAPGTRRPGLAIVAWLGVGIGI
jgi:hypothetical protein